MSSFELDYISRDKLSLFSVVGEHWIGVHIWEPQKVRRKVTKN